MGFMKNFFNFDFFEEAYHEVTGDSEEAKVKKEKEKERERERYIFLKPSTKCILIFTCSIATLISAITIFFSINNSNMKLLIKGIMNVVAFITCMIMILRKTEKAEKTGLGFFLCLVFLNYLLTIII